MREGDAGVAGVAGPPSGFGFAGVAGVAAFGLRSLASRSSRSFRSTSVSAITSSLLKLHASIDDEVHDHGRVHDADRARPAAATTRETPADGQRSAGGTVAGEVVGVELRRASAAAAVKAAGLVGAVSRTAAGDGKGAARETRDAARHRDRHARRVGLSPEG